MLWVAYIISFIPTAYDQFCSTSVTNTIDLSVHDVLKVYAADQSHVRLYFSSWFVARDVAHPHQLPLSFWIEY